MLEPLDISPNQCEIMLTAESASKQGAELISLANILDNYPASKTSVIMPGGPTVTYGELRDEVERVAETLAAVAPARQAVSIVLPNGLEFLVAFLPSPARAQ